MFSLWYIVFWYTDGVVGGALREVYVEVIFFVILEGVIKVDVVDSGEFWDLYL